MMLVSSISEAQFTSLGILGAWGGAGCY